MPKNPVHGFKDKVWYEKFHFLLFSREWKGDSRGAMRNSVCQSRTTVNLRGKVKKLITSKANFISNLILKTVPTLL